MAETEEEKAARKRDLAEAFADGFDIFESRREEKLAKERAANGDKDKDKEKPDDTGSGKSWAERLLGF